MPSRVTELHNIVAIENVPSIMQNGILSHERAKRLRHTDISMPDVQNRRASKSVPNGLPLHQYANLYFHARNPMMYVRQGEREHLCILRISTNISGITGIVFTDGNASSEWTRFYQKGEGAQNMDFDLIFANDWTHTEEAEYWRRKSAKCAEVLVPNKVEFHYVTGAYVCNQVVKEKLEATGFNLPITIKPDLFFC